LLAVSPSPADATQRTSPIAFRIFLASPGDVAYERRLAREAIEQLRSERRFRRRVNIEVVAWDQPGAGVAMEAGRTPQDAIARGLPNPADCDLAVVIFWARIGTPLPPDYERKPDGSPYLSGTEWEFLNALEGFCLQGSPVVWLYRRTEVPKFAADDAEVDAKLAQWRKLNALLEAMTNPDGSLAGGLNEYEAPDAFRRQFEQHLRDRLDLLLEQSGAAAVPMAAEAQLAAEPRRWAGVPYPGLEVFTPEQAPIFFGRGPEVDQLISSLAEPRTRFLAVVGVSGSGKSSLVAAGLVPRLRDGVIGGVPWRDLRFKPGERGDDPFLALAYGLKEALGSTGETERELADVLRADPDRFERAVASLLVGHPAGGELVLVVDQFEELFALSADQNRALFLKWLERASTLPRVRIIATLRADFYARAVEEPVLASLLRRARGSFPLDPPGTGALHEMIAGPAQAAGLELEEGLVPRVLNDAGTDPGALALVAFAMHELYLKGREVGCLTLADYESIGGVAGAVRRRAEVTLSRLQADAQQELDGLFAHLVEVNEQEVATRRRAPKSLLKEEGAALVDALANARLLVTGKGEGDAPTVEVAHEALLTAWPRLMRWIEQHAESLRARRDLERVALEWHAAGRPGSGLRTGPLLTRYRSAAAPRSDTAQAYLTACGRRVLLRRTGLVTVAGVALLALGLFWHVSKSYYPPAQAAVGLMVQLGLWSIDEPAMMRMPPSSPRAEDLLFQMGDLVGDGYEDEQPVHPVRFARPFEIGVYEVTFEEYDLFAAATGHRRPDDSGWGRGERPVINLDWNDAVAYADWLSVKTGKQYRLPTEAEWEYAARAGTHTSRYWKEVPEQTPNAACAYANVFDRGNVDRIKQTYSGITWKPLECDDRFPFTAPTGKFQPNAWGLHDMLGNVWEWTQDCWHDSYQGAPEDGSAWEAEKPADCSARVVRGGSWFTEPRDVRSVDRGRLGPALRNNALGLRLARSP
jgi:formylglycine-generating enzyme required for sulfatase activity